MNNVSHCWCGSEKLIHFSEHYLKCKACLGLTVKVRCDSHYYDVGDESSRLYNKNYWLETEANLPNILSRSSTDLPERCSYWLSKILKYLLPPAKVLEIGCGHGGLLGLMQTAGFTVLGTEMSPWIAEYAKKTFSINTICSSLENLSLSEKYDCIVLMDVIEHVLDPVACVEICSDMLNENGILVIQTPCFRSTESTFDEILKSQDIFVNMMREWEHLNLFSEKGIVNLLNSAGLIHTAIEPQLFPYDIFLFASKKTITINSPEQIADSLQKTSGGRISQALLNLYEKSELAELESRKRLEVIQKMSVRMETLEKECDARLQLIHDLSENPRVTKNQGVFDKLKNYVRAKR